MDNDLVLPEDMGSTQLMRLQAEYIAQHSRFELQREAALHEPQNESHHRIQRIDLHLEQLERNIHLIDRRLDHN